MRTRANGDAIMTVAELTEILQRFPASARVIVQGYESGFNDATGAITQPIVVDGNHRPRPGLGGSTDLPASYGGDHEEPGDTHFAGEAIEQAVLITSTRKR